jgi:hypothetical protein
LDRVCQAAFRLAHCSFLPPQDGYFEAIEKFISADKEIIIVYPIPIIDFDPPLDFVLPVILDKNLIALVYREISIMIKFLF